MSGDRENRLYNELLERTASEHLAKMIRCRTVSLESGGSRDEFDKLQELLSSIYPESFAACELIRVEELTLILRWAGRNRQAAPVILMAHQDVVEATGEWTHDPFCGELADGYVWGRGAIDDKGCLCAVMEAVERLIIAGHKPQTDILIVMSHNEEPMGNGAPAVVEWLRKHDIVPAMVLDEGGAIVDSVLPGVKGSTAMIGTGEKGYINVRFIARSRGGHASTPPISSPLGRLAAMIDTIERRPPFPARLDPVVKDLFKRMAPQMSGALKFVFGNLWLTAPILPRLLAKMGGEARALVMTTCAFTMAKGSGAPNVLPEQAEVTANLRVAVHQTVEEVMVQLRSIAGRYEIDCEQIYAHEPTVGRLLDNKQAEHLIKVIEQIYEGVSCAPYLMLAASDSHHFSQLTDKVFKFTPFHLTKELRGGIHGIDEKLPTAELARAVMFYEELIRSLPSF